jgi:23S rRNA (adenine2503-C2)-methyltransferase
MDPERLRSFLQEKGEPPYRAGQVLKAVLQKGADSYRQITTLPQALRAEIERTLPILSLREENTQVSRDGRTHKAVLALPDGLRIETVLLNPKPGHWSCCISSQVGCALKCSFCATGLMGLRRNLTSEEIADQVLYWRRYLTARRMPHRLENVVYMGMGEPFENTEAVFRSIRWLTDPALYGFGQRHIAVSTAGIAPGIEAFGREFRQASLALSLHAATDELRSRLVPLNRAFPLARLAEALNRYFEHSKQKVFIEYTLLKGENDQEEHARKLADYLKTIEKPELLHVNLIVFNPTRTAHAPAESDAARRFKECLRDRGIHATIRKNLGQDVEGACGQLIVRETKER